MTEQEHEKYGLETLRQLRRELEESGQFEKYPFDIGGPSWILRELKRFAYEKEQQHDDAKH